MVVSYFEVLKKKKNIVPFVLNHLMAQASWTSLRSPLQLHSIFRVLPSSHTSRQILHTASSSGISSSVSSVGTGEVSSANEGVVNTISSVRCQHSTIQMIKHVPAFVSDETWAFWLSKEQNQLHNQMVLTPQLVLKWQQESKINQAIPLWVCNHCEKKPCDTAQHNILSFTSSRYEVIPIRHCRCCIGNSANSTQ